MSVDKKLPESKKELRIRIIVQGLISTIIFLVLWGVLFERESALVILIRGVIFFGTWVGLSYVIYRPVFKAIQEYKEYHKK